MQRFRTLTASVYHPLLFSAAFFSFLRISNLVPYSLADLRSDKAYFLKRQHVSFTTSGAVLRIYRTKTIQFRVVEIRLPFIRNSALCPVTALQIYLHPAVPNLKHILFEKWHLIQNQPSLRQIFKEPPLVSFKRGKSLKDMLVKAKL